MRQHSTIASSGLAVNESDGRVLFLHCVVQAVEERFGVSSSPGSPEGLLYEELNRDRWDKIFVVRQRDLGLR
jgi:hypothetical protein